VRRQSGAMPPERFHRLHYALPSWLGPSDVAPTDADALSFVSEADMGDGWLMPNASNHTFLVELSRGSQHGYCIYKPQVGESPLRDFPTGTLYRRECASYVVSRMLGWSMVPPTVQREGDLGTGSVQLYVPPVGGSQYFLLREEYRLEVLRMAVFDIVVNNADRKAGHCFEDMAGGIWGIDHGLTFHVAHKLRTVIWDFAGQQVPEQLLEELRCLADDLDTVGSDARTELGSWVSSDEVRAVVRRVQSLVEEPIMPEPRSRRDIPWPWL
jgi:uncharacterized repeat protein (TIGR03843 family)